ncbi:hypothetical protein scyTo_0008216 [Scyliorhinus torazame]|uniref:Uncharacterized protein n=1 Tax=Scyliorhinus torazame TaxID=75743 RepID=A0A401P5H2_SCYTO|nr:hypothetical protein [Scyliorhinus torazame]
MERWEVLDDEEMEELHVSSDEEEVEGEEDDEDQEAQDAECIALARPGRPDGEARIAARSHKEDGKVQ